MNQNPNSSPTAENASHKNVKSLVLPPAILLVLLSAATVLFEILVGYTVVVDTIRFMDHYGAADGLLRAAPFTFGFAFVFLVHLVILLGALRMCWLTGYRSALAAAIVSVIPALTPGYILGIPLGIWAIVVLRNPEVRKTFAGQRAA